MPIKPDKTTAVASQKVLKQAGLTLAQMDVIELNKAFAAKARLP
jgi:acetyl-CoA acetyltransferase